MRLILTLSGRTLDMSVRLGRSCPDECCISELEADTEVAEPASIPMGFAP